jgi:hypothetical protein
VPPELSIRAAFDPTIKLFLDFLLDSSIFYLFQFFSSAFPLIELFTFLEEFDRSFERSDMFGSRKVRGID